VAASTSLGLIECSSLARGAAVADAMLKSARVRLLMAAAVSPGKLLVAVEGGVAEIEAAMERGLDACGDRLEDALFLPQVHVEVARALHESLPSGGVQAMGVMETVTVAAAIRAADAALKAAAVRLLSLRLGAGIGGKAVVHLEGEVADVEAAVAAGEAAVGIASLVVESVVLARPHEDYARYMDGGRGQALPLGQALPPEGEAD